MTESGGSPPGDRERLERADAAPPSGDASDRLVFDTIPGLIATLTADGEIEHVNRQVLDYTGRTFEEVKQWGNSDVVHPDDLPRVLATWRQALTKGLPYELEHRWRRADGVYRWFQVRGLPLHDDEGRIVRWHVLM